MNGKILTRVLSFLQSVYRFIAGDAVILFFTAIGFAAAGWLALTLKGPLPALLLVGALVAGLVVSLVRETRKS